MTNPYLSTYSETSKRPFEGTCMYTLPPSFKTVNCSCPPDDLLNQLRCLLTKSFDRHTAKHPPVLPSQSNAALWNLPLGRPSHHRELEASAPFFSVAQAIPSTSPEGVR